MRIPNDPKRKDSPKIVMRTPEIMGFLTWPYIPSVMSLEVGSQGANVPLPTTINIRIVSTISVIPITHTNDPTTICITEENILIPNRVDFEKNSIKPGITNSAEKGSINDFICLISITFGRERTHI